MILSHLEISLIMKSTKEWEGKLMTKTKKKVTKKRILQKIRSPHKIEVKLTLWQKIKNFLCK